MDQWGGWGCGRLFILFSAAGAQNVFIFLFCLFYSFKLWNCNMCHPHFPPPSHLSIFYVFSVFDSINYYCPLYARFIVYFIVCRLVSCLNRITPHPHPFKLLSIPLNVPLCFTSDRPCPQPPNTLVWHLVLFIVDTAKVLTAQEHTTTNLASWSSSRSGAEQLVSLDPLTPQCKVAPWPGMVVGIDWPDVMHV